MSDAEYKVDIDRWGVFTTTCGEKFVATCPDESHSFTEWWAGERLRIATDPAADEYMTLRNAISFRIELMPQQGGVARVPLVGGVDLQSAPSTVHALVCSVYPLQQLSDNDKKQYRSLIRHALDQMTAARARQSGLVLP